MSIMIPECPRDFTPSSQEGAVFEALKALPDDFYVIHSLKITDIKNSTLSENETDFVIFNKKLGCLCLEVKAGQVKYEKGRWYYGKQDSDGNNIPMSHGGPYSQASRNMHRLMDYLDAKGLGSIRMKCKFLFAVWFPSITRTQLQGIQFPSESDIRLTLTFEDLKDPTESILRIMDYDVKVYDNKVITTLNDVEANKIIDHVFCPYFDIIPSTATVDGFKKIVFHRMLKEQSGILNFLDEQRTAAINGMAGTGKTMIAVEKAKRHAAAGERVLFLCFNVKLKEYLEKNFSNNVVDYYTVAGYVCKLCDVSQPNYEEGGRKLEEQFISGKFPYKHIIIDEAQDLGIERIEEAGILTNLYDIVTEEKIDGTFYVFYDKLQLVQSYALPQLIEKLECRLHLYRNCRNTENIAVTSSRLLTAEKVKVYDGAVKGTPAKIHFCDNCDVEVERVNLVLDKLLQDGYRDIVLLTCKTEDTSALSKIVKDGKYRNKYLFTTCRKFKGLEADAVILLDVDYQTFSNPLLFYVGASRARLKLDIMAILSDDDCRGLLNRFSNVLGKIRKPQKDLSEFIYALGSFTS